MMRKPLDRDGTGLADMLERTTICVSGPQPGVPAHGGEVSFRETIEEHYSVAENNAVERLVILKTQLRAASTFEFWSILMEGMTSITGAQYGFVAKRILVDDQNSAVEMPPIGEPGSCLMGVAFFHNDGKEMKNLHRDYKYLAYGAPCHHMKHDKVFLIPNGLPKFVTNNPNQFPFPTEAYLGVPLFAEGKCFGHFGMMWSEQGVAEMRLAWAYIEMLLHSLEDLILDRLVDRQGYAKDTEMSKVAKVIPSDAVTAAQSLKPYARSLSHELRTPMQGVVGMLDVMYATVQESLEGQKDVVVRKVLKTLRENIEVVQDSSRRAVEAADNVVHAYDLNMQVPDTPVPPDDDSMDAVSTITANTKIKTLPEGGKSVFFRRSKRQRTSDSQEHAIAPATKHRHLQSPHSSGEDRNVSPHTASLKTAVEESDGLTGGMDGILAGTSPHIIPAINDPQGDLDISEPQDYVTTPGLRHTKLRELLHLIINESLRVGGRPDSAVAEDIDGGEIIEVRTRTPDGESRTKVIEWSVDPQIPEMIYVDERDLAKLVSCVFLNAVKFTEVGRITLRASLTSKAKFVVINVTDTGVGIPEAFHPYLFKPFSREDDSLTRQKEGLGLGLLVAKGLARKIGGDLICVRSNVSGPDRGSEFELRVPLSSNEPTSRAETPTRTPTPTYPSEPKSKSRTRQKTSASSVPPPRSSQPVSKRTQTPDRHSPATRALSRRKSPTRHQDATPSSQPATPSRRPSTKHAPTFDRHLAKKYPLSFLVAEDNKINRKLLVSMLGKLGYTDIHEAYDGAQAVHQMSIDRPSRGEKPIDVILMDLWMPNMDGYEATQRIFAHEKEKEEHEMLKRAHEEDSVGTGCAPRIRRRIRRMRMVMGTSDGTEDVGSTNNKNDITCDECAEEDEEDEDEEDDDEDAEADDYDDGAVTHRKKVTVLAVSADVTDSALERASKVGMEGFMPKPYKLLDLERLILEHCVGQGAIMLA